MRVQNYVGAMTVAAFLTGVGLGMGAPAFGQEHGASGSAGSGAPAAKPESASPAGGAASPAAEPAKESTKESANEPEPTTSAADRSTLESTGRFTEPALKPVDRKAFGTQVGSAGAVEGVAAAPGRGARGAQERLRWGGGGARAFPGGGGAVLSRRRGADGKTKYAATMGMKLSLATGGLATLLVATGALTAKMSADMSDAGFRAENAKQKASLLDHIAKASLDVRFAHRGFRLTPTDEALVKFSNACAVLDALLAEAKKALPEGGEAAQVAALKDASDKYNELVAKVVQTMDQRTAETERAKVAAERVAALVDETVGTLQADAAATAGDAAKGRLGLVVAAMSAEGTLKVARANYYRYMWTNNEADSKKGRDLANDAMEKFDALAEKLTNAKQKAWVNEASLAITFWDEQLQRVTELKKMLDDTIKQNSALGQSVVASTDKLTEEMDASAKHAEAEARDAERTAQRMSLALSGVSVLLAAGVAVWLTTTLSRAAGRVLAALRTVAEGDLSRGPMNAKQSDELGEISRASDVMALSLRRVLQEVNSGSREVSAAATEIAASAEEMSAAVSEVAQQSTRATQTAESSGKTAIEGGGVVRSMIDQMRAIETAVTESAASVTALGKRGEEIGAVISVINDIADQTNLLALNAAIEAARAGEHGRGFAVVADEVRKLADRTTKATEEIGGSIKAIQEETSTAVSRMHRGTDQVRSGVESAAKAGQSLEQIVSGASDVASMITSISAAAEEAGAGAHESASAASTLSKKAVDLNEIVSRFKL